jgi:hypothetical protein
MIAPRRGWFASAGQTNPYTEIIAFYIQHKRSALIASLLAHQQVQHHARQKTFAICPSLVNANATNSLICLGHSIAFNNGILDVNQVSTLEVGVLISHTRRQTVL